MPKDKKPRPLSEILEEQEQKATHIKERNKLVREGDPEALIETLLEEGIDGTIDEKLKHYKFDIVREMVKMYRFGYLKGNERVALLRLMSEMALTKADTTAKIKADAEGPTKKNITVIVNQFLPAGAILPGPPKTLEACVTDVMPALHEPDPSVEVHVDHLT